MLFKLSDFSVFLLSECCDKSYFDVFSTFVNVAKFSFAADFDMPLLIPPPPPPKTHIHVPKVKPETKGKPYTKSKP